MTSLENEYKWYSAETNKLKSLITEISIIEPKYQKFIVEMILIRVFYNFENYVSIISKKVATGCIYSDSTSPVLLLKSSSITKSDNLFKNYGRNKPLFNLNWATAKEIKGNVSSIIDPADNFVQVIDRNGTLLDEIRRIRNRIAHNNPVSRSNFYIVVRRYYGAIVNHITPGTLLLTNRKNPILINQYLSKLDIVARDLIKK